MKWSKMSHIGLVRKNNEDNCCVCDDIKLFAVADGMGGHKAGEIASRLALDELTSYLRTNSTMLDKDPVEALRQAVCNANAAVLEFASTDEEKFRGMGTTITAAVHQENKIYVAHVGDSRAYLIRGEEIRLLTSDHSLVNELVKSGGITPEEAENHPQKNVLTRAIGTSRTVDVDINIEQVLSGDIIILCTDGLSNLVNPEELKQLAGTEIPLQERAKLLTERALDRGGGDNITVVLFQIE